MMAQIDYINEAWRQQGVDVREVGDHILELRKGDVVVRFSQTGVEINNILKEIEAGKYGN